MLLSSFWSSLLSGRHGLKVKNAPHRGDEETPRKSEERGAVRAFLRAHTVVVRTPCTRRKRATRVWVAVRMGLADGGLSASLTPSASGSQRPCSGAGLAVARLP